MITPMFGSEGMLKLRLLALYGVCYCIFYLFPNFYPLWLPAYLPLLPMEQAIPFVPWTFVIYISDYLMVGLVIIFLKGEEFLSLARMIFAVLIFCGVFFIFFPTTYPRPDYPDVQNGLVQLAMNVVSAADRPTNCFPSHHVAITGVSAWASRFLGKKSYFFFCLWAIAIFLSTLTTKQHYFMDIVGGLTVVITVVFCEWLLFEKKWLKAWIKSHP